MRRETTVDETRARTRERCRLWRLRKKLHPDRIGSLAVAERADAQSRAAEARAATEEARAEHARNLEAVRAEKIPRPMDLEGVRVAANRLISEGRTLTPVALRAAGARGRGDELMAACRELAVRGMINRAGYDQGRDRRQRLDEEQEQEQKQEQKALLALEITKHIADACAAWRRITGKVRKEKANVGPEQV